MNVNITGIYDNTVIVDSNLFDDVKLLQTGLSSLNDTLFSVVEGLPYQYANLTTFTTLSNDYDLYKITNNSNISDLKNITTNLSNKTNFSNLLVSGSSTLLSSLNVSGTTTLNGITTCRSSLNVSGTTTLNGAVTCVSSINVNGSARFNNVVTCISSLNVSSTTRLNGATTLFSTLNVVGNIIGSGTALTNLNYDAITNKPDLTNYVNNTIFQTLSDDYEAYKITNNSYISTLNDGIDNLTTSLSLLNTDISNTYVNYTTFSILNNDIDSLTTSLSILNTDISNTYVNNTTLSVLTTAVDDQFETTITYIDDKATEQHEYTDQEVEALRNEGYIQEAITQVLAWATSDEGKRFRKKLWARISSKWTSFTGGRPFTELIDDVTHATSDELDDLLKVYRYDLNNAGIRTDPIIGKDIVMKGDTYIYDGHLYLTGDIHKGTFNSTSGAWTEQKNLNNYFVMKGVKTLHCLDINNTTELLELHYDDLDFELGPAPYYYLKLKYP